MKHQLKKNINKQKELISNLLNEETVSILKEELLRNTPVKTGKLRDTTEVNLSNNREDLTVKMQDYAEDLHYGDRYSSPDMFLNRTKEEVNNHIRTEINKIRSDLK